MEKMTFSADKLPLYIFSIVLSCFFIIVLNYRISSWVIPHYSLYDVKRILEIVLLSFTVIFMVIVPKLRNTVLNVYSGFPELIKITLLLIFSLGVCSALRAPESHLAIIEVSLYLFLFIFALTIAGLRILYTYLFDRILLLVLIVGLFIYEVTFFKVYVTCLLGSHSWNVFPGFANIRFLDQYLVFILPVVVLPMMICSRKSYAIKICLYGISIFAWMIAISNNARGMYISLFLSALFALIIFRKKMRFWLLWQIISIIGGWLLYKSLYLIIAPMHAMHVSDIITNNSYVVSSLSHTSLGRYELWKYAISLIAKFPLLGVGPLHFAFNSKAFYDISSYNLAAHPHNSLLLIASEWGLIVTLLVCIVIVWAGIKWIKNLLGKDELAQDGLISLTISLNAGIFYSLISGVTVMPLSQVMLFLTMGWMLGICVESVKEHSAKTNWLPKISFGLIILLMFLNLAISIIPEIVGLPERELNWIVKTGKFKNIFISHKTIFKPRLWHQGMI